MISCAGRRTQIFPRRSALRHRHQGGRPAGVSQPTVTGQLRQLESRYGVELFHRQGRGLRLSDAGHRLMPLVEKLVQQESEIEFRLRDASDLREGCLRVGATGPFYIMDTVRRYNQRYPAIELSVAIGNSQSMLQALHDYRIDVATSSVAMNNPNLYRRAIAADPLRIVVHRDHPLAARLGRPGRSGAVRAAAARARFDDTPADRRSAAEGRRGAGPGAGDRQPRIDPPGDPVQPGVSLIPSREVPAQAELATVAIADTEVLMHEYLYCLRERQPVQLIARFLELAPSAA